MGVIILVFIKILMDNKKCKIIYFAIFKKCFFYIYFLFRSYNYAIVFFESVPNKTSVCVSVAEPFEFSVAPAPRSRL